MNRKRDLKKILRFTVYGSRFTAFMDLKAVTESAARRCEKAGLDSFEVAAIETSSVIVEAKRQMVDIFERHVTRGVAVRVIKDRRLGFSATTDLNSRSLEDMVAQSLDSMKHTAPSDEADLPPPRDPTAGFAEHVGRAFDEIPDSEKIRAALSLESAAIASDSRVSRVQHPRYEEFSRTMHVMNSKGVRAGAARGLVLCELRAVAEDNGDAQAAHEFSYSPRFEDMKFEEIAKAAASRAVQKLGARQGAAGKMPVVFSPRAASAMLKIIAPSFFAGNVQRGKSVLAGRKGGRFFGPNITLIDDGLLSGGYGSFPFDGEGVPKRKNTLVLGGAVESWLYDGARAAIDKTLSTGSCERDNILGVPTIGVSNFFLKALNKKPFDIVKEAGRGIIISDILGAHTANTITGDFSLGIEGFEINGGAIGAPVRGMTIAANVHDLFGNVADIGNDLEFFGSYGAPTILVDGLMVGA